MLLAKLNKEIDLSWEDINKKIGWNYSPCHTRKMAYGVKFYNDFIECDKSKNIENNSAQDKIDEINNKVLELKKMRTKLSDERTLANKRIRSLARIEDFIDLFRDEIAMLSFKKPLLKSKESKAIQGDTEAVLVLSDIHYGIESDNAHNLYNPDVAKERMTKLIDRTIYYCKKNNVGKLHIFDLGDSVSGNIHNTIRLENRLNIVNQIIGVSELLSESYFKLSENIADIEIYMAEGNHDRVFDDKKDNLNEDTFSTIIKEFIKLRLCCVSNIKLHDNKQNGIVKAEIKNKVVYGTHGDKDKFNAVVKNIVNVCGEIPDYVIMGHYHNANEYTDGYSEVIVNGCFSGVDEYAYNIRAVSYPVQKLLLFNNQGRYCTYNIRTNI